MNPNVNTTEAQVEAKEEAKNKSDCFHTKVETIHEKLVNLERKFKEVCEEHVGYDVESVPTRKIEHLFDQLQLALFEVLTDNEETCYECIYK
jgi:hypothetical protein